MTRASNISRIQRLLPVVIDRIAAGEVIDGPYSVVKELMENALDAGARRIVVKTQGSGMEGILVVDDGRGIPFEDLPLALERHATSKIADLNDLDGILSFGFRGEALASIASVSHCEVSSHFLSEEMGGKIVSRGGEIFSHERAAVPVGTSIHVRELFYSVPARKKHVRSPRLEDGRVYREVVKAALAHPGVRFEYFRDGKEMLILPPHDSVRERVIAAYGPRISTHLLTVDSGPGEIRLTGVISDPQYFRASRDGQYTFINGRPVDLRYAAALARKAYGDLLPHGAQPCLFLFFAVDPERVDVNVHPAKREVRLLDESVIHGILMRTIHDVLRPRSILNLAPGADGGRGGSPGWSVDYQSAGNGVLPSDADNPFGARTDDGGIAGPGIGFSEADALLRSSVDAELAKARSGGVGEEQFLIDPDRMRILGVVMGTYILAEAEDGLYIIDQHTAHERVNYERMRGLLEKAAENRQPLMVPVAVDTDPAELDDILAHTDSLLEAGFVVEEYGPSSFVIREVPSYIEPGEERSAVIHVVRRLLAGETMVRIYDEYAAMKACKASIKKNDVLPTAVLAGIVRELAACKEPARCPHGRPTVVKLKSGELDRLFGRIM